jgi:ribonucleotide reductase beta subunit family protein with ferritin-like domain
MRKINLMTKASNTYRPFVFEWAHEAFLKQQGMHWMPNEIDFSRDKRDYSEKLTVLEKEIIKRVLLFFTQMDVEVGKCYLDLFIPYFQNLEIRRMLVSFANMEQIHAQAYNQLIQELDLPLDLEEQFLKIKEMSEKHDYIQSIKAGSNQEIAQAIAVISGGAEGFVLYSSFAVLFSFSAKRAEYDYGDPLISGPALIGVGQVIEWSMRDESHHSNSMIRLCLEFIKCIVEANKSKENLSTNDELKLSSNNNCSTKSCNTTSSMNATESSCDKSKTKLDCKEQYKCCKPNGECHMTINNDQAIDATKLEKYVHEEFTKLLELEYHFIDYIFKDGDLPYLSGNEVKGYVRYLANLRLKQLRMKPIFENPIPLTYMEEVLFFDEFTNFFDAVPTAYSKLLITGDDIDDSFN